MIKVNVIESYKDYGKCVSISNGVIEAYVTVDIGPRIIKFGFVDGQNIMCDDRKGLGYLGGKEYEDFFGDGKKWESFGGHRVWITTEKFPDTYTPDDQPVTYKVLDDSVEFSTPDEIEVGIAKTLTVKMDKDDANMMVKMDVKNVSGADKEFSVWAITVSAPNGTLIMPMNTNDTGLLHNRQFSVWPYTDMSDKRIYWGSKYLTLAQDTNAQKPIKLGMDLNAGVVYYVLGDDVFSKRYEAKHGELPYPDGDCSFETYTNNVMIEIETLSDVKIIENGKSHEWTEMWSLYKKPCDVDFKDDASIDNFISKI